MANLKEIRMRIVSVSSTMQITSAMKMVSAAKLKRATDAITRMRPYSEKLSEILSNVSSTLSITDGMYSEQREVKKVLVVAITSNRGLCGGFNNNILKEVRNAMRNQFANAQVDILSLGKKAFDAYKKTPHHTTLGLSKTPYTIFDALTFANASAIAEELMHQFATGNYDKIVVVFNRFKNAAVQIVQTDQFLPILPHVSASAKTSSVDYIYEPNKASILDDLIPRSLKISLYKALLDSNAAEHGARMTSMHKATDNAGEMVKELKLTYNKARQAAITGEILEIVAGAEALNG